MLLKIHLLLVYCVLPKKVIISLSCNTFEGFWYFVTTNIYVEKVLDVSFRASKEVYSIGRMKINSYRAHITSEPVSNKLSSALGRVWS